MKRIIPCLTYGAAILTVLFAVALPIKLMPIFLSWVGASDLKIAPWFSGGEKAFVINREIYQIQVYRPVYPALVGKGEKGFVQLVWQPRNVMPERVEESLDLNRDGIVDCELSFFNPKDKNASLLLTVIPKSPWVLPVQDSPTTSLSGVLIEKGRKNIFVRIPVKTQSRTK
jgi:hypothetical protein